MKKPYLFIDSIVVQLSFPSNIDAVTMFRRVARLLSEHFTSVRREFMRQDKLVKFRRMHILRDSQNNNLECLEIFSFTREVEAFSWFSVYARKEGVYVELHSMAQYMPSFTLEKQSVLHLLYMTYTEHFSFSRIDVAIDVKSKFSDVLVCDVNSNPLQVNEDYSSRTCFYFEKQNARGLKIYSKTSQRNRTTVLPYHLTRVELTLKRTKLKTISSLDELSRRFMKELFSYRIFVRDEEVILTEAMVYELTRDLYSVLENGSNTLLYANKYKNIMKQSHKALLSYECFRDGKKMVEYAMKNDISYKTLRQNISFYKSFFAEKAS
jgi:hypothetical protein